MVTQKSGAYCSPAGAIWVDLLKKVIHEGTTATARGTVFREVIDGSGVVDMEMPIVDIRERKLGYKFMAAEAAWIISGDCRVETIWPYARDIVNFSDDGLFFNGAYGPMITAQLPYICQSLNRDPGTRQAVLTIWRPSPGPSKDIPCTVSVQWLHRGNQLHCIYTMRSSDLWLGAPYDWFNFSMLSAYVLLSLRRMNPDYWQVVRLGALYYRAGSCHIYEKNQSGALIAALKATQWGPYRRFLLDEFDSPKELLDHLWALANGRDTTPLFATETGAWREAK